MEKQTLNKSKEKQVLENQIEPHQLLIPTLNESDLKKNQMKRIHHAFLIKLQQSFLKRIQTNPNYSLRAFAKKMGVDQSFLSKVFRGQKFFSETSIREITPKLGVSPLEEAQLWELKNKSTSEFQLLEEEKFQLISNWSNFAVLELIKTKSFIPTAEHISDRLNIHIEEARSTLKRLQNLGFINIINNRITLLLPNNSWTNNQFSSEARIQLQNNLIDKSKKALNEIHYLDRDHGSLTVAIDSKRLPEFKEKLFQIRKELDQFFQSSNSYDEVYQLTLSFFPLTNIEKDKNIENS